MTKHPTARRTHREASEPDDVFIARVLEITAWAKHHVRALVLGGAAVVLVGAAAFYYGHSRAVLRTEAVARLTELRQTAMAGNNALAIRDLEAYLSRFGGTAAADEARVLLARIHLGEGDAARAREVVADVAADLDGPVGVPAALLLAASHEQAGDAAAAEAVYLRIAEEAPFDYQRRDALDAAARLRADRGDAAGAAELFRRLVGMAPEESPERAIYELRLAEAEARAAGGAAAGS